MWSLDSGEPAPAEVFAEAARQAYGASDLALAQRLARRALADRPGVEAVVTLAAAMLFDLQADHAERLLADLWPGLGPADRLALTLTRGFNLQVGLARPADALLLVTEAEPYATDPALVFQLGSLWFGAAYMTGDYPTAISTAEPLLAGAAEPGPAYALTSNAYADCLTGVGKPERALKVLTELERRAPQVSAEMPVGPSRQLIRIRAQLRLGQPATARRTAQAALDRWLDWDFGTIAFGAMAAAALRLTGAVAEMRTRFCGQHWRFCASRTHGRRTWRASPKPPMPPRC